MIFLSLSSIYVILVQMVTNCHQLNVAVDKFYSMQLSIEFIDKSIILICISYDCMAWPFLLIERKTTISNHFLFKISHINRFMNGFNAWFLYSKKWKLKNYPNINNTDTHVSKPAQVRKLVVSIFPFVLIVQID